ncbi:MAG: 7-carboxy-7-deazaguanine synthase, partial [Acidobacteriota bacterium]
GEGAQTGRPAVFCRFAGCNLWSGREQDRERAVCRFCDTDFLGTDGPGGGVFACAGDLAEAVAVAWPAADRGRPMVVCTGGEPLLQLDTALVQAFRGAGLEVALETNGTLLPPERIDWVCVSPKAGSELALARGDELKLVYPQKDADPEMYQELDFRYFFLQPMDGPALEENTRLALRYCLDHPRWRLSLQIHKFLGIR